MSESAVEATGLPHCPGLLSRVAQVDHLQGVGLLSLCWAPCCSPSSSLRDSVREQNSPCSSRASLLLGLSLLSNWNSSGLHACVASQPFSPCNESHRDGLLRCVPAGGSVVPDSSTLSWRLSLSGSQVVVTEDKVPCRHFRKTVISHPH